MVKSIEQAKQIQGRRVTAGKRGYAKAVRRCLLRLNGRDYQVLREDLPVHWGHGDGGK